MSVAAAAAAVVFLAVAVLSAREKARQRDREISLILGRDLPPPRETPLSQGLVDLVAVAGGIYLSLIMVASFVGYELPQRVAFLNGKIDPIAAVSVVLALVEPFVSRLIAHE